MHKNTTPGRALAITAGVAATGGAIALLVSDALNGHFTTEHALVPLVVLITVASGHLAGSAIRAHKPLSAIGFLVAFAVGTAITLLNGVGRQAEGIDGKIAAAEHHNTAITDKRSELERARNRLSYATRQADDEMTGQKCLKRCRDWKDNARDVSNTIAILERELAALGPATPVAPKAEKVAAIAALFGGNPDRIKAGVRLLEPVMIPFLLEWTAIVAFGFAFGHVNRRKAGNTAATVTATVTTVANDDCPMPPKGGNRRTVATKAAAEADVIRLVARGEQLPSQDTLASRWLCHKGTVSKWVAEFEARGIITRTVEGRCKRIAAA